MRTSNGGSPVPPTNELSSWKEIASYLRVSVRTAQMWEAQRALPVRRLPGPRGRVSVSIEALEAWKTKGAQPLNHALTDPAGAAVGETGSEVAAPSTSVLVGRVLAQAVSCGEEQVELSPAPAWRCSPSLRVVGAIVACMLAVGAIVGFYPGEPAGYRVGENAIIVLDALGRELWRKGIAGLNPRAYGREQLVWLGDLDADGHNEVLMVPRVLSAQPQPLLCLSNTGAERWRFTASRMVRTTSEEFRPPFMLAAFAVTSTRNIVVASTHLYFPAQVVMLSPAGTVLREYWHSGHLNQLLVARQRDGRDVVYLGGISNARKQATLIALDAAHWAGTSTEPQPYQFVGFSPGRELARLFFPRPCMNQRLDAFNAVGSLQMLGDELIVNVHERMDATSPASVLYHFTPDLRLQRVGITSNFAAVHHHLHVTGELDHEFGASEEATLHDVYRTSEYGLVRGNE